MRRFSKFGATPALVASLLLLASLCGCGDGGGSEKLSAGVRKIIESVEFQHSSWTIKVVDLETGKTVYEQLGPGRMLDPASNTKLITVATALDVFGPEYRFETPVYQQGDLGAGGRLSGNLIMVASGDLVMGGRGASGGKVQYTEMDHADANALGTAVLAEGDPLAGLDDLAAQVAASGVKSVDGDVIIDARLFETTPPPGNPEGPKVTPIFINDNLIDLIIKPTSPGNPAEVDWRPRTSMYEVDPRVSTVAEGEEAGFDVSSPGAGIILIEGRIPAGSDEIVQVYEVEDPASFARTLFIEALERAGVSVESPTVATNPAQALPPPAEYDGMKKISSLQSPPFSEQLKLIMKVSHNVGANTLLPLVAVHEGKEGTFENGLAVEHDFLEEAGVDTDGLVLNDGEGGPGNAYACAESVVQLLRYMSTRDDFEAYKDTLPVLGVDGSLAQLLVKSPAKGKVQAKTGTHGTADYLNGRVALTARALGGYMTSSGGKELAFQVTVNMVIPPVESDMQSLMEKHARVIEVIYQSY